MIYQTYFNDTETNEILEKFQKKDKRIKVMKGDTNLDPIENRNKAIQMLEGKYFAF